MIRLVVLALMLAPAVAAACPACTGQNNRSTNILTLVGAFMLVPFGVFYAVLRVVRRSLRPELEDQSQKSLPR